MIMEFEELQQIWDLQNNQPLYAINEKALHNRVLAKKNKGYHITNISELLLIIVNIVSGFFILGVNLYKGSSSISMYILAAWMLISAACVLISRIRRIVAKFRFDRSLRGDLNNAISIATYQVRLSQIMRWNIIPIGILVTLIFLEGGKSIWIAGFMVVAVVLVFYAGNWEHGIYKSRKKELEILQSKLENESN
jgi:hypothetical protein